MEFTKAQVLSLKAVIKRLALEQTNVKAQRKTVHLKVERTLPPWKANFLHMANRDKLRYLYIAYGFMRGKTLDQIEPNRKTEPVIEKVNHLVSFYGETICTGS
jgi:hypothetical protein